MDNKVIAYEVDDEDAKEEDNKDVDSAFSRASSTLIEIRKILL
jgi:hypothetical protein